MALLLGSLYAIFNPPFAVNDERDHWLRVVEITNGRLRTRSDAEGPHYLLPKDHHELILRYSHVQRKNESRVNTDELLHDLTTPSQMPPRWIRRVANASGYSAVPYLPHIPAVWLARILHLPPVWQIYLARFASVGCYALITAWAVAIAGNLRWMFFVLGLMPMSLTQAAGLSGDGAALSVSFSFFALLAKGTFGTNPLSRQELGAVLVQCAVLPLCRPPYLLFTGALLALRWQGDHAERRRWLFAAAGGAVSAAALFGWMYLNRNATASGSDVLGDQLGWLRDHPGQGVFVLLNTLIARVDDYLIEFVVVRDVIHRQMRFLGGLMSGLYLPLLLAVTWGAAHRGASRAEPRRWRVLWIALAGAATVGAILLAMYMAASAIGANIINGVQGRYFIPVAPALLLPLASCGTPVLGRWLAKRAGFRLKVALTALNVLTVLALIARYYAPETIEWPY